MLRYRIASPQPNATSPARVPAGLDLTGSIVVLTHPRTGSSLLMQTLRLLGADVFGEAERPKLPAAANPRGYYENEDVLVHGCHAAALARQPALLRGRAFKLSLTALVSRRSIEEWRRLREPGIALLLSIRSPLESLCSQQVLIRKPEELARRSLHHLGAVRNRMLDYAALARWVTDPEFRRPPPAVIDYPLALTDPRAYVELVAHHAGLQPTAAQRAAASANIDRALHRFTTPRVNAEQPASLRAELLEEVYRLLQRAEADPWNRVGELLPAWAREAARWLTLPSGQPAQD